jgi:hypothetical protein
MYDIMPIGEITPPTSIDVTFSARLLGLLSSSLDIWGRWRMNFLAMNFGICRFIRNGCAT